MPNANLKLLNALTTIVSAYGGNGSTVPDQSSTVPTEGGHVTELALVVQSKFVDVLT